MLNITDYLSALFSAAAEAVEEAIVNALLAGEDMDRTMAAAWLDSRASCCCRLCALRLVQLPALSV